MTNLGNSTTPSSGYVFDDFGSGYQYWTPFTMPAGGGVVTDLYVYIGGDGVSFTGDLCIWGSTALLWSGSITFPSDGRSTGGQGWLHLTVPSLYIPAGTVNLGVWAGGNVVWTYESSGNVYRSNASVGGSPTTLGSGTSASNALGAYIVYTPWGAYINTGTYASPTWTAGPVYVNTGTYASPVLTAAAGVYVNTGTYASPIWTPAG